MNYKLNVHDLVKCLTAPLTDVNHRWLNLCTHSLNTLPFLPVAHFSMAQISVALFSVALFTVNPLSMSVTLSSLRLKMT